MYLLARNLRLGMRKASRQALRPGRATAQQTLATVPRAAGGDRRCLRGTSRLAPAWQQQLGDQPGVRLHPAPRRLAFGAGDAERGAGPDEGMGRQRPRLHASETHWCSWLPRSTATSSRPSRRQPQQVWLECKDQNLVSPGTRSRLAWKNCALKHCFNQGGLFRRSRWWSDRSTTGSSNLQAGRPGPVAWRKTAGAQPNCRPLDDRQTDAGFAAVRRAEAEGHASGGAVRRQRVGQLHQTSSATTTLDGSWPQSPVSTGDQHAVRGQRPLQPAWLASFLASPPLHGRRPTCTGGAIWSGMVEL